MSSTEERATPAVPGYTIEKKLAQGGMGVVYVATDDALGRRVAIKMIRADVVGSTSDVDDEKVAVTRFMNEARAAAQIKSAHVATVLTFGQTKVGDLYLVLEYLDGITLTDVLKREKRLDVDRALRITQKVCRGLKAAHALGIVHRDLKPSNVMLVEQDGDPEFVKILDFGVAKKISDRESDVTRTGALIGTHTSMAPEQITGGAVDARTDIYAIGCLLFRLLTGKSPFVADDFVAVLHAHLHRAPPKPSSIRGDQAIPSTLDALVTRCLAKDPADRIPTTAELERLLGAILARDKDLVISSAEASAETALHVDIDAPTQTPWATVDVDSAWSSSNKQLPSPDLSAPEPHAPDPHTPMTSTREVPLAALVEVPEAHVVASSTVPYARIAVGALIGSVVAFAVAAIVLTVVLDRAGKGERDAPTVATTTTEPRDEAPAAAAATTPAPEQPEQAAKAVDDGEEPAADEGEEEEVVEETKPQGGKKPSARSSSARASSTSKADGKAAARSSDAKTSETKAKPTKAEKPSEKTSDKASDKATEKSPAKASDKSKPKPSSTTKDAAPATKVDEPKEKERAPRADFRRVRTAEDQ